MLQAISTIDPRILATSLTLLAIALGLLVRRRILLRRLRRERLADQASAQGDGETSVMPLAHLASAVEVLDLDDLLAGEEGSVVAAARRELEAPTNVSAGIDTYFPLPSVAPSRREAAAAPQMVAVEVAAGRVDGPAQVAETAVAPPQTGERAVPVRELALAWFEARGYRPSSASQAVRPIELVLRHRKDPGRAYPFIVEQRLVTSERVAVLVGHAQSIGLTRVLVAAESGIEPGTGQRFRRQGVRLVDQREMRREFEKLDLRIAAKIIAVARGRARLHQAR